MPREYRVIELDDGGFPSRAVAIDVADEPVDPVDQVAAFVRKLYIYIRRNYTGDVEYGREAIPQFDGGVNRWGKQHQPIWPRVAIHLMGLGANPATYIRCQFHHKKPGTPVVKPNQLYSAAAVERFAQYQANVRVTLTSALEFESASIRAEVCILEATGREFIKAIDMAVMNTAAVMSSPLLRYCMAHEYHLPAAMQRWHNEALLQYLFEIASYDRAWAGWLPESLQHEGRELASRMLS